MKGKNDELKKMKSHSGPHIYGPQTNFSSKPIKVT